MSKKLNAENTLTDVLNQSLKVIDKFAELSAQTKTTTSLKELFSKVIKRVELYSELQTLSIKFEKFISKKKFVKNSMIKSIFRKH